MTPAEQIAFLRSLHGKTPHMRLDRALLKLSQAVRTEELKDPPKPKSIEQVISDLHAIIAANEVRQ